MKSINKILLGVEISRCLSWIMPGLLAVVIESTRAEVWSSNDVSVVSAAMSADGRVVVIADQSTQVSLDYGATWHSNNFAADAVAISADGNHVIAAGALPVQTWISDDAGTNWNSHPAPTTLNARQLTCSADGTRAAMVLFGSGPIFLSANGGLGWSTNNDAPTTFWTSIKCSADGHRVLACSQSLGLWLSTNSGANWSSILASNNLAGVACSADGRTIVAASGTDVVYISSDFGVTWSWQHVSTFGGSGAACSADGSRIGVISYAGAFLSTDSGRTWAAQTNAGIVLNTIATSADGHRWITGHSGGQGRFYLGSSIPAPVLQLESSSGNILISWIIPSLPFSLQESESPPTQPGWHAWAGLPNLNLNTLQLEATIPVTNTISLFRLNVP